MLFRSGGERGTGATAIDKGQGERGQQTLGEVEILVGKTAERAIGMAKFYRMAWYEIAWKWNRLMHVNAPKNLKLFKIARTGKAFPKTVTQKEWKSDAGYEPLVRSSSEQEQEHTKGIQKFMFIIQQFPNNLVLRRIAQKRMLEIVDLTAEELREVEEAEKGAEALPQEGAMTPGRPAEGGATATITPPAGVPQMETLPATV